LNKPQKHILVIRLSAMGDVAMTIPVLRAAIAQNQGTKFTILSRAFLKPLFKDLENVSFIEADVNVKHKGIWGLYKLYKELKQLQFDAIVDLHNVLRSKILRFFFLLSRINIATIDKGRTEKRALTRINNKVFKQLKTTHERYADVLRKLNLHIDLSQIKALPKKNLTTEIIKITGTDNLKWIGIAPFAQYQSKMYPLGLMESVIKELEKKNEFKIFLFGGGKKEIDILKTLSLKFKNVINVAGGLTLGGELTLISNLDCMMSMDSANSHLAAMYGVKTITLWGVTHPFAGFAAFKQSKEHQLLPDLDKYPNLPCSIYGNKVFKGYEDVMRSIPIEKVVEKIVQ